MSSIGGDARSVVRVTLRLGPLPPELPLGRSRPRDGDVLSFDQLTDAARETISGSGASPVAELVVVGGPAAGRRVGLTVGSHTVGRDAAVDVTIDVLGCAKGVLCGGS